MATQSIKLNYSRDKYPLVLKSSYETGAFYALDSFEVNKLKILMAKYGCRHSFHTLPDTLVLDLLPFYLDEDTGSYRVDSDNRTRVQLNKLEEVIVTYKPAMQKV